VTLDPITSIEISGTNILEINTLEPFKPINALLTPLAVISKTLIVSFV
jgi:hypothetical protein